MNVLEFVSPTKHVISDEDMELIRSELTDNAFCPTGPGGGIDPTCSPSSTTRGGDKLYVATRGEDNKWRLADGTLAPKHIQTLGIPPAWSNVQVNLDKKADLYAKGVDAKGRAQFKYSDSHNARAAAAKFGRIRELLSKREMIYAKLDKDSESRNEEKRENADCLRLVMQTGMRPGSDNDTLADHKSYGATTLEGRHIIDNRDGTATIRVVTGKNKGREVDFKVDDRRTAENLISRAKAAGKSGRVFKTDADTLRNYSKSKGGRNGGFKTKDHRTALGTEIAQRMVNRVREAPSSKSQYKAIVKEIATKVSNTLGNTPAVALKSYIDPQIFRALQKNIKL